LRLPVPLGEPFFLPAQVNPARRSAAAPFVLARVSIKAAAAGWARLARLRKQAEESNLRPRQDLRGPAYGHRDLAAADGGDGKGANAVEDRFDRLAGRAAAREEVLDNRFDGAGRQDPEWLRHGFGTERVQHRHLVSASHDVIGRPR
jgi:hypothetical protein